MIHLTPRQMAALFCFASPVGFVVVGSLLAERQIKQGVSSGDIKHTVIEDVTGSLEVALVSPF
jgi:hypothetical protein